MPLRNTFMTPEASSQTVTHLTSRSKRNLLSSMHFKKPKIGCTPRKARMPQNPPTSNAWPNSRSWVILSPSDGGSRRRGVDLLQRCGLHWTNIATLSPHLPPLTNTRTSQKKKYRALRRRLPPQGNGSTISFLSNLSGRRMSTRCSRLRRLLR